jgi:MULE transposase domain
MEYGRILMQEGGTFVIDVDSEMRIDSLIIQTKLQKSFLTTYGDFFVVDGTHCTNMHNMTLILPAVIDCLGKTKIVGIILCHYESHDDILKGLKVLGIGNTKATIMTDGGAAFASVAEELGLQHCLCTYHFAVDLFSTTSQMDLHLREDYINKYNRLLHGNFSQDRFEHDYKTLHSMLSMHPIAQGFVEKLYAHKNLVAYSFVREYFTAGCRSSQRSESINSILKHGGSKNRKELLKMFSLVDLVKDLDSIFTHQYREDYEYLRSEMTKGGSPCKDVSAYVFKYMSKEKELMDQYKVSQNCIGIGHMKYSVQHISTDDTSVQETYVVTVHDEGMPTCTCEYFTNRLMPCRHIASTLYYRSLVSTNNTLQFFDPKNVSPRWRLSNNPLYKKFAGNEGTEGNSQGVSVINRTKLSDLTSIRYPTKATIRHAKLSQICYPAIEEGKKNEYSYRVVMGYLTKCINGIMDFLKTDGTEDCMEFIAKAPCIRTPVTQNNRHTSTINSAKRLQSTPLLENNKKRGKRMIECSACRFYQNICVTDHREYSQKCPQRDNPNHHCDVTKAEQTKEKALQLSQLAMSQTQLSQTQP